MTECVSGGMPDCIISYRMEHFVSYRRLPCMLMAVVVESCHRSAHHSNPLDHAATFYPAVNTAKQHQV